MRRRGERMIGIARQQSEPNRLQMTLIAALALVGVLPITACGGASAEAPPQPAADGPTLGAEVNLELPDVLLSTYQGEDVLGGSDVYLSDVVGLGKPVLLNFWAALCGPCRAEMPDIQSIFNERSHEVTIVSVDIGPQQFLGSRKESKELLEELRLTYPVGTTFDDKVVRDFEIVGMPTTFFINADGSLMRSWSGLLNEEKLNEFVDDLVLLR